MPAKSRRQVEKRIASAFGHTRDMRSAIYNAVYNRREPEMEKPEDE